MGNVLAVLCVFSALEETQEAFRRHFVPQFKLFKEIVRLYCCVLIVRVLIRSSVTDRWL